MAWICRFHQILKQFFAKNKKTTVKVIILTVALPSEPHRYREAAFEVVGIRLWAG